MKPILIVDDEVAIADLIAMTLRRAGYAYQTAHDGLAAADMLEAGDYALALLDIMLPQLDGYDLLDYAQSLGIPVIFITARGAVADRVKGLRLGADDYIVKPFEPTELLARVEGLLRRTGQAGGVYTAHGVALDTVGHTVSRDGAPVALTPLEFDLLMELMRRPGHTLTR